VLVCICGALASIATFVLPISGKALSEPVLCGLTLALTIAFIQQSFQAHKNRLDESRRHLKEREHDIEELEKNRKLLADLYVSTVNCLATAIDAKDECTHAHIRRVQKLAVGIAETMNVSGDELEAIRTGALLHDVGKLAVPDSILGKLGPLTDEEFLQMKLHTVVGAEMLEPVRFPWPVVAVVRHHHERWDGAGYPDGLAGEQIPLSARIMAVADVYDALTSDRPYRPAWGHSRARRYILDAVGAQFDPAVVDAFLIYIDSEPILSAVSTDAFRPMKLQPTSIFTTAVIQTPGTTIRSLPTVGLARTE